MVGLVLLAGVYVVKSRNGNGELVSFRWRDYLPSTSTLKCYLSTGLAYAARSYQQAVLASLATQGDPVAIKAWRELMNTYNPSELICMMGVHGLDQLAAGLSGVLPQIAGLSWATRQGIEAALYKGLETVRER